MASIFTDFCKLLSSAHKSMITIKDCVLITDVGSVDIDDVLATLMLITNGNVDIKGIISSHHYSDERAKQIKLLTGQFGRDDIPIYVGHGIPYQTTNSEKDRATFIRENPLFPLNIFGAPVSIKQDGERQWYPNFSKAFNDEFTEEYVSQLETVTDSDFLENLLRQYSPENKLSVICIAPPHDLAKIPVELYPNMDLWCMGGGFEDLDHIDEESGVIPVTEAGYNWGITPAITNQVLNKLTASNTMMTLISSKIVRKFDVSIPLETYEKWDALASAQSQSEHNMFRAIMTEWQNSNRGNKLKAHKNMCDPLVVHLFANDTPFEYINVTAKCDETQNDKGSYLITSDLISMVHSADNANVRLVTGFDRDVILNQMLCHLNSLLK